MMKQMNHIAHYHLPGLFEFVDLYQVFLPLFYEHREYFYDWCDIGSLYGCPADCIWGGGRLGAEEARVQEALALAQKYGISARLTFSNSLLRPEHLSDPRCNALCARLAGTDGVQNGIIVHAELLTAYLRQTYPQLYLVSSTTKVLDQFPAFVQELNRPEFRYVVADYRLNNHFAELDQLSPHQREKTEFLCNTCCWTGCQDRRACYEAVSREVLGEDGPEHVCRAPHAEEGYRFSRAMQSPAFISLDAIQQDYLPRGFTQFKIEGRSLGSALILEFLLYYLTRPAYQLTVREDIYLSNTLDLF